MGEAGDDLPDVIHLHDEVEAMAVWPDWVALERKFLPYAGGLVDQPERLMSDLLTLDGLVAKMQRQVNDQHKPKRT
jgi:hypothetical protein